MEIIKKITKKLIPYVCKTKAAAAGIAAEIYRRLKYNKKLDEECIRLDRATEDCARKANPSYKLCDLK